MAGWTLAKGPWRTDFHGIAGWTLSETRARALGRARAGGEGRARARARAGGEGRARAPARLARGRGRGRARARGEGRARARAGAGGEGLVCVFSPHPKIMVPEDVLYFLFLRPQTASRKRERPATRRNISVVPRGGQQSPASHPPRGGIFP